MQNAKAIQAIDSKTEQLKSTKAKFERKHQEALKENHSYNRIQAEIMIKALNDQISANERQRAREVARIGRMNESLVCLFNY